jgi:hypothetical protein
MYTTNSDVAAKLHGNGYIAKQSVALKAVTLDFEAAWPIAASTGAVHRHRYRVALLGSKRIFVAYSSQTRWRLRKRPRRLRLERRKELRQHYYRAFTSLLLYTSQSVTSYSINLMSGCAAFVS